MLNKFSDEDLLKELARRKKRRRGKVLGYRVITSGDEYTYGTYRDFIIGEFSFDSKKNCKARAEEHAKDHCGSMEVVYKDNLEWTRGKIH